MTQYVLLTDNDNGTALVQADDDSEANAVAAAAVFSDGGVSAWLVPARALVVNLDDLSESLRDGEATYEIHEAHDEGDYAEITMVHTKHLKALLDQVDTCAQEDLGMVGDLPPEVQKLVDAANLLIAQVGFEPINDKWEG